ncbi:MAG: hypothetical protein ACRC7W_01080 [Fusobacteriaceae bacterium]
MAFDFNKIEEYIKELEKSRAFCIVYTFSDVKVELEKHDKEIKIFVFSPNFGQHTTVLTSDKDYKKKIADFMLKK